MKTKPKAPVTIASLQAEADKLWTGTFAENLTADDRRKQKYLGWTAFDVCADGGLELHCFGPCDTNSIPPPTIAELLGNRPTVAQN